MALLGVYRALLSTYVKNISKVFIAFCISLPSKFSFPKICVLQCVAMCCNAFGCMYGSFGCVQGSFEHLREKYFQGVHSFLQIAAFKVLLPKNFVLTCVAESCSVLQCVAMCCNVLLQRVAVRCSVRYRCLQSCPPKKSRTKVCCRVCCRDLQRVTVCISVLQCVAA